MKLSKSQEHYIKAIYELSHGSDGIRSCDIASLMHLSKASVSVAMKKLVKKGLLEKDVNHHIHLTVAGKREALRMMDSLRLIQQFLVDVLHVDKEVAKCDACAIEHVISIEGLCSICRYCKRDKECSDNCLISQRDD